MTTVDAILLLVAGICGVVPIVDARIAWVLVGVVGLLHLI